MVQHIGLWVEDESGNVLSEFHPDGIPVELLDSAPDASACVRFIDPYGDTVFNQLQLPVLIAEIEQIARSSADDVLHDRLCSVVAFLQASVGVHAYVRFTGD